VSTYQRRTKNPVTGEFEEATWLDDHFGRHRYGVQFPDGKIYRQSDHQWEFDDPPSMVYPPPEKKVTPPPAIPPMVPSAKERVDAVYEAWTDPDAQGLQDIEVMHERAMQQAYDDGFSAADAACREKLAAMMLRQSIPTGHGDTFDDLLRELETRLLRAWVLG